MSERKHLEHLVASVSEDGRIIIHVEIDAPGEYVGDFTLAEELIEDAIAKRLARPAQGNEK